MTIPLLTERCLQPKQVAESISLLSVENWNPARNRKDSSISNPGNFGAYKKCRNTDLNLVRMIQVDISGHPPFPNGSKQCSDNFGNLLFLAGFNFRGHFEGPNEGFSKLKFSMITEGIIEPPK
jgi:hypothetical protein